jgi:hypothetical protein
VSIMRWFQRLSATRKVLLILAPGMLTLAFDAFVPHWSWNNNMMKWNQYPPVIYGLLAFALMGYAGTVNIPSARRIKINQFVGVLGIIVGVAGVYFHGISAYEGLEGEELGIKLVGETLKSAPPLFAPAAFAGIGLLLFVLHRLTSEETTC